MASLLLLIQTAFSCKINTAHLKLALFQVYLSVLLIKRIVLVLLGLVKMTTETLLSLDRIFYVNSQTPLISNLLCLRVHTLGLNYSLAQSIK